MQGLLLGSVRQRKPTSWSPHKRWGVCYVKGAAGAIVAWLTCQSGSLKAVELALLGDLQGNILKCYRLRLRPMAGGTPCIAGSGGTRQARPLSGRPYSALGIAGRRNLGDGQGSFAQCGRIAWNYQLSRYGILKRL
jgi:hypothetical protein